MSARRAVLIRSFAHGPIAAIAIAAAGCAEPGAGLEPFPSDGVSAFGPAEPIDVCIGSARVAPGGAVALCMAEGASPIACASDADCEAPERCQCGQCVVRACGAGSVCPTGEACRGGRCTASCVEDAACGPGEKCNGGGCAHVCAGDADCHRGEICDFLGVCSSAACGPSIACGAGQTCTPLSVDGDVREPTVVRVGEEDVFFFELRAANSSAIYRAIATDPLHWKADPDTPVLTPPEGATRAGAPSAIVHDGRVDLFVAIEDGASIGLASSKDSGRTFAWTGASLLAPEQPWEDGFVGSPGAFVRGADTYVLYEGGARAGIGLAKLAGGSLTRVRTSPVLRPSDLEDAAFWRSVKAIGSPFALVDGDAIRVYVTANGVETGAAITPEGAVPTAPNDSIGLFATTDLEAFDRYPTGPVYRTIAGLFGSLGEREPAVSVADEGADLYFLATDASGTKSSGLSVARTAR